MPYNILTLILNFSVFAVSIIAIVIAQRAYMGYLSELMGLSLPTLPIVAIIVGFVFTITIAAFNIFIINRKVREISRKR